MGCAMHMLDDEVLGALRARQHHLSCACHEMRHFSSARVKFLSFFYCLPYQIFELRVGPLIYGSVMCPTGPLVLRCMHAQQ